MLFMYPIHVPLEVGNNKKNHIKFRYTRIVIENDYTIIDIATYSCRMAAQLGESVYMDCEQKIWN